MAIKILSGILVTRGHRDGRARIDLDDNELIDAPAGVRLGKARRIGRGRYDGEPCKMVALREIDISVVHPRGPRIRDEVEHNYLRLNDVSIDERYLEIAWEAPGGEIEEIAYMVIGEVS